MQLVKFAGLLIAFLLAFLIGIRGTWLIFAGLIGWIPAQIVVMLISMRLFSVEFEPTGDVRDILYSTDEPLAPAGMPQTVVRPRGRIGARAWEFFVGINQPRSIEGYALQAGALILAAGLLWMACVPLLRSVFPGFDANRTGPNGFPVFVHIGASTISFTNKSGAPWTCRAELGTAGLSDVLEVGAGRTTTIQFERFDSAGRFERAQIRSAAQDQIRLVCREPSGLEHEATLPQ